MKYKNLTLIGSSHIAKQSINEVTKEMTKKPDIVALELDKRRLYGLLNEENRKPSITSIPKIGLKGFLFALIGSIAQQNLGKIVEIKPGTEMKLAFELSEKQNAKIALIDRDIEKTLNRLSKEISWKEKARFAKDLVKAMLGKNELKEMGLEFDLNKVPSKKTVKKMLNKVKEDYPNVYKVLVTERNQIMAERLALLMKAEPNSKILAIVGAGHEDEIIKLVKEQKNADIPGITYTSNTTIQQKSDHPNS